MSLIKGEIFLTLTAIIWGTSFVSQKLENGLSRTIYFWCC